MLHYFADCEWKWDPETLSSSVCLTRGNKEVLFHPDYSCGTAAAKGSQPLTPGGEYYWEINMTSAVYGTDMVGDMRRIVLKPSDRDRNRQIKRTW